LRGESEEGNGDGDGNELRDSEPCVGTEKRKKAQTHHTQSKVSY
jgi:hypothetical protein